MTNHPSRNLFVRLNVYLPWDDLEVGQSFFLPGGSVDKDESALRQSGFRRGYRVTIYDATEAEGDGVRVRRIG